jgi:hypothetical protein
MGCKVYDYYYYCLSFIILGVTCPQRFATRYHGNLSIQRVAKRLENIVHVCYWVLHIKENHAKFWDKFKMKKIELTNTSKCTNHYKKVINAIIIKLVHHKPYTCKGHHDLNLGGIPTFLFTLYSIGPHGG